MPARAGGRAPTGTALRVLGRIFPYITRDCLTWVSIQTPVT
jgi:hypothetical protein